MPVREKGKRIFPITIYFLLFTPIAFAQVRIEESVTIHPQGRDSIATHGDSSGVRRNDDSQLWGEPHVLGVPIDQWKVKIRERGATPNSPLEAETTVVVINPSAIFGPATSDQPFYTNSGTFEFSGAAGATVVLRGGAVIRPFFPPYCCIGADDRFFLRINGNVVLFYDLNLSGGQALDPGDDGIDLTSAVLDGTNTFSIEAFDTRGGQQVLTPSRLEIIEPVDLLDHFALEVEPDTIRPGESCTITTIAEDADSNEVFLPDSTLIILDMNPRSVGGFIDAAGDTTIGEVALPYYVDLRSGRLKFFALSTVTGTQSVELTVQKADDGTKRGSARVVVNGCFQPPRYPQCGVPAWSDSTYDHLNRQICDKGCALSSMGMMMTAFGDTINPYELNAWMVDPIRAHDIFQGGYGANGKVSWYPPMLHSNGQISIDFQTDSETKEFSDPPSVSSILDSRLEQCKLIIVKVSNNGGEHWVLVTRKEGGRYKILDPGGRIEEFLDGYGDFWSWRAFSKSH